MRFLLDMGLGRRTAEFLRALGHDAVHLRDQGLQRMADHDIVAKAMDEDRILLTHDLDFGRLVALSGRRQPSVITFRLEDMRAVTVNRYLQTILAHLAGDLTEGVLVSVSEQAVRVRRLPIDSQER